MCVDNFWPSLSINICKIFFYTSQFILSAVSMFFVINHFHIFTMFPLFLCILLTKMPGMLAPIPKPHAAVPKSKSGYVDGTAISIQPIQTEETAI